LKPVVLIVDDNPANTKLVRALLESQGYEVDCAAHANEARRAIERRVPALVLMDLQLPEIDGYELTREFRRTEALRQVPILAVTASAMRGDEQRALDAGCNGYIAKPINTRTFVGTISAFMVEAASRS
jgi:CheY-like chemotaxis protein